MIEISQGDNKAQFIHIPKTGGSTVTKILTELFDYKVINKINGREASHLPIKFIPKDAPRFAFVRSPIMWHESLYKMLRSMKPDFKNGRKRGWNPVGMAGFMYADTFDEFIDNILNHAPDYYSEVLEWYMGNDLDQIDHLGHTFTLNTDLCDILTELGFEFDQQKVMQAKRLGVRDRPNVCNWAHGQQGQIREANKLVYEKLLP